MELIASSSHGVYLPKSFKTQLFQVNWDRAVDYASRKEDSAGRLPKPHTEGLKYTPSNHENTYVDI